MVNLRRRLLLVRHGQTAANAQGRTVAVSDPPLNDLGREQAVQLGDQLGAIAIDLAVSSPYLRCTQTLQAIMDRQVTPPRVRTDDRLREVGMGAIEGLSQVDIRERGLESVFREWRQGIPPAYPEGAETFEAASTRLMEAFTEVTAEDCETTLIVGHSHALRILIAVGILGVAPLAHRRMFLDHATVTVAFWEAGVLRIETLNSRMLPNVWSE